MSHYAKIIAPLEADVGGKVITIQSGQQVRRVTVEDNGFRFDVHLFKEWRSAFTSYDLPAFTDRGAEQREDRLRRSTLQRGRPRVEGVASGDKHVSIKITAAMHAELVALALFRDQTISEIARDALRAYLPVKK